MEAAFQEAAKQVTTLPSVGTEDQLSLYGLYKQATIGDVNSARPGIFDLKGRAKWDAWEKRKGLAKEAAMTEYVALVKRLLSGQ